MNAAPDTPVAGRRHATSSRSFIALLAACTATGPITTNMFVPALPEIRAHFGVSVAASQTMLTAYLIAFAFGLLVSGPLSDRFGRRPLMLGGLTIFAVGSLLCVASPTLGWLVAGRIVQAVGTSAAFTVARGTVGDLYEGAQLARQIATLTMVLLIGTTISPLIGGVVAEHFGWIGGFWILFAAGAVLAVVCWRRFPETRRSHSLTGFTEMLRSARSVLAKRAFFAYAAQAGVLYALFLVFIAVAPHVLSATIAQSPSEFGLYYILVSTGYFFGNLQTRRRAHSANVERLMALGLWIQLGFAVLALGFVLAGLKHPLWIFGPMFGLFWGQGLVLPNISAKAVGLAPGFAGTASSLLGFAQQAVAALAVQVMGWAPTDSAVPVMLFCTVASVLALVPVFAARRRA